MSDTVKRNPRKGIANTGRRSTLAVRKRTVPIVVIPGIMGTRLYDPTSGKIVWNPLGPGSKVSTKVLRLLDPNWHLAPAGHIEHFKPSHGWYRDGREIPGFYELIPEYYGNIMVFLHRTMRGRLRMGVDVYGMGYDWRQSNAHSARLMQPRLDRIAAAYDERMIIIAHSMGGLVARFYARRLGGARKIRAMFLVGSPTLGAPEAYTMMKGEDGELMTLKGLGKAAFGTGKQVLSRRFPSPYELLPVRNYPKGWLRFDPAETGYPSRTPFRGMLAPLKPKRFNQFSDTRSPKLYSDLYTGVVDTGNQYNVGLKIGRAYGFHVGISNKHGTKVYAHPHTFALFDASKKTVAGGEVTFVGAWPDFLGRTHVESKLSVDHNTAGDGSVPAVSAAPPKSLLYTRSIGLGTKPQYLLRPVSGAHRDLPSTPSSMNTISDDIARLYGR